MSNLILAGRAAGKKLVISGCVPQGDKRLEELKDLSLLGGWCHVTWFKIYDRHAPVVPSFSYLHLNLTGVTQIDRVVEVVEETLKGNMVQLLAKKALPKLDLPKVGGLGYMS